MTKARASQRMLEFALTYAHGLLASASVGIISFYYAQISAEYSLGAIAGSLVISMFSLCGALGGGVITGWYLARADLYRVLFIGSALMAVSSLGALVPLGATGFLAMRVIASFGFIIVVTVVPIVFARYGDRRGVIGLALWGAYLPLGIALGTGASALALRMWGLSWPSVLAAHGVVLLVTTLALRSSVTAHRARDHTSATRTQAAHQVEQVGPVHARLRRIGGVGVAYAAGFGAFATVFLITAGLLPRTLMEVGGLTAADAGVTASLVLALGALGSLAVLYLLPRVGNALLLFGVGFAGSALGSLGLYMAHTPEAVACFAIAIVVTSSLIPATAFARLPDVVEHVDDIGTLNGLLTQVGCLGSLIGPPLIGWWVERFGYASGWIPFVFVCAAGFSLFTSSLHAVSLRANHPRSST